MNCYSRKIIKNAAADEYNKMYAEHARQMSIQIIATVLYCFHLRGWRKKRLHRLFREINSTYELMGGAIMGEKFNAEDCAKFIKDTYGIDLEKEISVEKIQIRGDYMNAILKILTILLLCFGACNMIYALNPKATSKFDRIAFAATGLASVIVIAFMWGIF